MSLNEPMTAEDISAKAAALVGGERAKSHGDKAVNHANIGRLWSAYLGVSITPVQVALMMALLKIARTQSGSLNLDDFIDLAGYAGCAGEMVGRIVLDRRMSQRIQRIAFLILHF